jgi:hypothetical protein
LYTSHGSVITAKINDTDEESISSIIEVAAIAAIAIVTPAK